MRNKAEAEAGELLKGVLGVPPCGCQTLTKRTAEVAPNLLSKVIRPCSIRRLLESQLPQACKGFIVVMARLGKPFH